MTSCVCSACADCRGHKSGLMSRLPYIFLFFTSGMFAIFMALYGEKEWLNLPFMNGLSMCNSTTCEGNGSVYRVAFILFVFELLHVLLMAAGAVAFHHSFFMIKVLVFCGCLVLTFVVGDDSSSNEFFYGFAIYFARYVSAIYLLLQILILIEIGYRVNELLQEKADEAAMPDNPDQDEDERAHGCNVALWGLVGGAIVLYVGALTLCGLFFVWYGDVDTASCGGHRTFIALTIILILINGVVSVVVGNGSFFVSAVVSFYVSFLCFAALQADDDKTCNVWAGSNDTASLWIGFILTFLAIFGAALRADKMGLLVDGDDRKDSVIDMSQPLLTEEAASSDSKKKDVESGDVDASNYDDADIESQSGSKAEGDDGGKAANLYFHLVMTLAACYMAMCLTSWGTGSTLETTGKTSMIVNVVCQYATALLFWWTLCAPAICPSRFANEEAD